MEGWVEGIVARLVCALWRFASVSSRPAACFAAHAAGLFLGCRPFSVLPEGSVVVLKCVIPIPKSDKLKLHGQLPFYLLAFRLLNRWNILLHVNLILYIDRYKLKYGSKCLLISAPLFAVKFIIYSTPPFSWLLIPIKPWAAEPSSARCAVGPVAEQSCLWGAGHSGSAAAA